MGSSETSVFHDLAIAPLDAIFALQRNFLEDSNPKKANLGIGVYRDENGKPYLLPVVTSVEKAMAEDKTLTHDYLPITGLKDACDAATRLALGNESTAITQNRVSAVQSLSGTGAISLAAMFLKKFYPSKTAYVSSPTWGNHNKIFAQVGYEDIRSYRYFNPKNNGLDIEGMIEDLRNAPNGSVIVLHACAHNPTGVDPSKDEWQQIANVIQEKNHFTIFDMAYQGFATGDPDTDARAVRYFAERGLEFLCGQSFAKIFGLYNERIGNLFLVCKESSVAAAFQSQMAAIIRPMYSNPPNHGARIVATILNNPALTAEWRDQLKGMSDRIQRSRKLLYEKLKALGTPGDWQHIITQNGMFTFTGLNPKQVDHLIRKFHIYLLKNGRINMCGINPANCDYIVEAIHDAVTCCDASL
ncbi:aspartate aminotransferase, cytoplasmic-like [Rhopilema esculentum]|uniref:aspartate aminotransferase, cytoplasmic-like n=1 Tax=Rhopilema esculentum TaxID=499914 RepID=UPI0031DBF58E|eukprot:gene12233-2866_t